MLSLQSSHILLFLDPLVLFDSSEIFTSQTVHILLDCFKDTYDINKQMAFDLLAACPASIHPFQVRC